MRIFLLIFLVLISSCTLEKIKARYERDKILKFAEEYVAKTSDIYNPLILRNYPQKGKEDEKIVEFLEKYEDQDSCCISHGKYSGETFVINSFHAVDFKQTLSSPTGFYGENLFTIYFDFEIFDKDDSKKTIRNISHLILKKMDNGRLVIVELIVRPLIFTPRGYLTYLSYESQQNRFPKEYLKELKKKMGYVCSEDVIVVCKLEKDSK